MEKYRSAFTTANLFANDTKTVTAGESVRLGSYTVKAKEQIACGFGYLEGQENAVGRIYADIKDTTATPVALDGVIRLSAYTAQDRPYLIIAEFRTETLRTSKDDRTKQLPFAEHILNISEDNKLVLEFIPDKAGTVSKANSTLLLDMTMYVTR